MARPLKDGLPYIGLPTDWFKLTEHKILRSKLGDKALLIWTDIYLSCFERHGYYLPLAEDDTTLLAVEHGTNENFVRQVTHFLAQRSLIDHTLLRTDKVVTSRDIQLTFQEAARSRGKSRNIEVREQYWLLDRENTKPFIKLCPNEDFSDKNSKNPNNRGNNAGFHHPKHHKEKERKEKESKRKSKLTQTPFSPKKRKRKHLRGMTGQSVSQRGELLRKEYERICGTVLPKQDTLTQTQITLIRKGTLGGIILKDYRKVFEAAAQTPFLKGANGRWRATFQWLVTPEKTKKVLSGTYRDYTPDKQPQKAPHTESPNPYTSFDTDEFFQAALKQTYGDLLGDL